MSLRLFFTKKHLAQVAAALLCATERQGHGARGPQAHLVAEFACRAGPLSPRVHL